jgi:hypothetical protein
MSEKNPRHKETLIAVVEQSPAAVAIHDKQAWMGIFAQYHVVEDPVGSAPHFGGLYDAKSARRGRGALDRFFDTFIAPNDIVFDVQKDVVCANHVVRDLTVHISMSGKVNIAVPMHLLYELVQEQGEWKIMHLAAHWELLPMMKQLISQGIACVPILSALTVRMLKLQGLSGMLGFSKAVFNIGERGKQQAQAFISAFNNRDNKTLETLLEPNALLMLPFGAEAITAAQALKKNIQHPTINKVMVSGDIVSASLHLMQDGEEKQGVVFFEFNKKTRKIAALRCYF